MKKYDGNAYTGAEAEELRKRTMRKSMQQRRAKGQVTQFALNANDLCLAARAVRMLAGQMRKEVAAGDNDVETLAQAEKLALRFEGYTNRL